MAVVLMIKMATEVLMTDRPLAVPTVIKNPVKPIPVPGSLFLSKQIMAVINKV